MEKKIKLVMNGDKSIEIFINDVSKYIIKESEREISAKTIYKLLDYKIGDIFSVLSKNKNNIDTPVLVFFKELFENICERINEMNLDEDDTASLGFEIGEDSELNKLHNQTCRTLSR